MVLKIGNYMNGGTQRGGAYGFTFQSIEKVRPASYVIANALLVKGY